MNMKKHLLTQETLRKLQKELRNLVDFQRPSIIQEIQEAREQGDLSENADYDAAKSRQTEIESRIQEIQEILNHYQLIDDSPTSSKKLDKVVKIGSTVSIHDFVDKQDYVYEVVGSIDTAPENKKISNESPLAKAILGQKENEIVEVRGIATPYKVKILQIS